MKNFNETIKNGRAIAIATVLAGTFAGGCAKSVVTYEPRINKVYEQNGPKDKNYISVLVGGKEKRVYNAHAVKLLNPGTAYLASTLDYSRLPNTTKYLGKVWVIVNVPTQTFRVFDEKGKVVLQGPVGTGKPGSYDTELGNYEIITAKDISHRSSKYPENVPKEQKAPMPYAMHLKDSQGKIDGKAIHGSGNVIPIQYYINNNLVNDYSINVGHSHGCGNFSTDHAKQLQNIILNPEGKIKPNVVSVLNN